MSPETWCEQELGSLGHKDQQTTLLIQIKGEEEQEQEIWKQGRERQLHKLHTRTGVANTEHFYLFIHR